MKNNRVVRPKTYDRPGYRSQERKHRALARAADADFNDIDEEEYRKALVRRHQQIARQIADGSYVNEPWAPNAATRAMLGGR